MKIYPIGTVVTLTNGEQELMITSRFPLYNNNGEIGYFEYGGCLFPQGQMNENNFFFNEEDIETIHFKGYESSDEKELREELSSKIAEIKYPKIAVKETY